MMRTLSWLQARTAASSGLSGFSFADHMLPTAIRGLLAATAGQAHRE